MCEVQKTSLVQYFGGIYLVKLGHFFNFKTEALKGFFLHFPCFNIPYSVLCAMCPSPPLPVLYNSKINIPPRS